MKDEKVRIKNDEQKRKAKRKRVETDAIKDKKKRLHDLKDKQKQIKALDKETESQWSKVEFDDKDLMSMGLVSLEVMDDADFVIERPGKRKKTTSPLKEGKQADIKSDASNNLSDELGQSDDDSSKVQLPQKQLSKKSKKKLKRKERLKLQENLDSTKEDIEANCETKEKDKNENENSEPQNVDVAEIPKVEETTSQSVVGKISVQSASAELNLSQKQLSIAERKLRKKLKRKQRITELRLKRKENPDDEKEILRKEKLKAKRKAKKARKAEAKPEGETSENQKDGIQLNPGENEELKKERFRANRKAKKLAKIQAKRKAKQQQINEEIELQDAADEQTISEPLSLKHGDGVDIDIPTNDDVTVSTVEKDVSINEDVVKLTNESGELTEDAVNEGKDEDITEDPIVVDNPAQVETSEKHEDMADLDTCEKPPLPLPAEPIVLTEREKDLGKLWLDLNVCDEMVKALVEMGFTTPTPIQNACIPAGLLRYKDVVGAAETGSGKTLAFGIPLIQRILRLEGKGCVRGLVLCPTRELALQVTEHLRKVAKYTEISIVPIVGGMAQPKQLRLLSYKPPILVATPGRLWQLLQECPYLQDLSKLKFLVIDETDRMIEDGHFEEVKDIIGRLPGPDIRNTFLFSATLSFTIDRLDDKAKKKGAKVKKGGKRKGGLEMLVRNIGIKDKVEKVDFTLKKGTAELLKETYILSNLEDKDVHLYYILLNHPGKILVFVNSIDGVMNLVHIMQLLQLPVQPLHSSLQQRQRLKFLDRFREQEHSVLICTDVAARGLDIPDVDTVVHYQLPLTTESYIHRSGRTARAECPGLSIAVVGPKDFKTYKKISSQMTEFPLINSRLRFLRPPLQIARQIFKIERLKARPEKREAKLVALAQEAGLDPEQEQSQCEDFKRQVKVLRAQLGQMLEQPVIDPLNSNRYVTTKGAANTFQTLNKFSLGTTALEYSSKDKDK